MSAGTDPAQFRRTSAALAQSPTLRARPAASPTSGSGRLRPEVVGLPSRYLVPRRRLMRPGSISMQRATLSFMVTASGWRAHPAEALRSP